MAKGSDHRIIEYLKEARACELTLLRLLTFHGSLVGDKSRREAIAAKASRTEDRLEKVTRRMHDLGFHPSPGPGASLKLIAARAFGLVWRPLRFLTGGSTEDRLWDTAKQEVAVEGRSIANYFALETLADRTGDQETARLAADLRDDEERMLEDQRREVPELAEAAVRAELAELSFDMSESGSWWAYDEMTTEQVKGALARVHPPESEQRERSARQGNGSLETH